MKLLLVTGTHPRHLYVNKELLKHFEEVLVIILESEEILPATPKVASTEDQHLFKLHFSKRLENELQFFGDLCAEKIFEHQNKIYVKRDDLNSARISQIVSDWSADFAFIFGSPIIKEPLIGILPKFSINLHLGLSPWFRGSATLFWPFYLLMPQYAGVTFHYICHEVDAGPIVHQSVPTLEYGDSLHSVACKCVMSAAIDINDLVKFWKQHACLPSISQTANGKLWMLKDFMPSHLRIIYDLYDDQMVDKYLNKQLPNNIPKLIKLGNRD